MWSSSLVRAGLVALALAAPLALSACSGIRPVYGTGGVTSDRLELSYAKPGNRLDQVVIQDLILRLGNTERPDAPRVTVSTSVATRALTRTGTVKPAREMEAAVVVAYTIVQGERTMLEGARKAVATYSASGQVLADEAALKDASERAAHEAADLVRLAILGGLATPVPPARQ